MGHYREVRLWVRWAHLRVVPVPAGQTCAGYDYPAPEPRRLYLHQIILKSAYPGQ